ncbi:hypothetical protein QOL99_11870 [Deinococcus sp. MIMF12]|uniref:Toprim domain-containing protein n=1 Tax=Deinococcus rhizophilus TaxID=3049544 RepID=A0ABT7JIG1_9DEIO|nr:hypothetical protein [Deinococcus rhizophilus]MDL2344844.1 hypothetical protein [Deinococcus rhizophilus]
MTGQQQPQLFQIPRTSASGDAMESTLLSLGQDVLPAPGGELPAALAPDLTLDLPAPSIQEQPRQVRGPWGRVDRAAVAAQASITDLVQQSGRIIRERVGICPACGRNDLDVNPTRNTAHCFHASCDFHSVDPIGWLMRVEGYQFLEAVAVIRGEPLPGRSEPRQPLARPTPREKVRTVTQRPFTPLALAAQQALWAQETPVSQEALNYLLSRGFSGDELEQMGVGVADSTVPSALLPLNSEGRPSVMWHDRVIIPTWRGGEVVNLKARTLTPAPPEGDPAREHYRKYLNPLGGSAELIGLEELGGMLPDGVILTEGELDYWTMRVLMPDLPVVAVRGLANLSPAQAQLFAGLRVYVLLDADTHGRRMLLGDLAGLDDAQATETLKSEGQKHGAALAGRRLVQRLRDAGADPWICETGAVGDLNDLLASMNREDTLGVILNAIETATPLRRRRRLA